MSLDRENSISTLNYNLLIINRRTLVCENIKFSNPCFLFYVSTQTHTNIDISHRLSIFFNVLTFWVHFLLHTGGSVITSLGVLADVSESELFDSELFRLFGWWRIILLTLPLDIFFWKFCKREKIKFCLSDISCVRVCCATTTSRRRILSNLNISFSLYRSLFNIPLLNTRHFKETLYWKFWLVSCERISHSPILCN